MRKVPLATVARLPVYVECLKQMASQGRGLTSSQELADAVGVNPAQLRKDLSFLGYLGTPGVGYQVNRLLDEISSYLGLKQQWSVAIVGAGKLGTALANYHGFEEKHFNIAAIFDIDPQKVGTYIHSIPILPLNRLPQTVQELGISIAIITTPANAAQSVADQLTAAGIRSVLNFAPTVISVPEQVTLRQVDLSTEMQILAFYENLRQMEADEELEAHSGDGGEQPDIQSIVHPLPPAISPGMAGHKSLEE